MGLSGVDIVEKINNNSWGKNLKQILIKAFNESEATLPKGMSLGYDVKKVAKIIEESETPKIAKERMQKELKLKPMPPRAEASKFCENDDGKNGEEVAEFILKILGLG